ncbi:hypothetical protein V8C86DRAFT_3197313, partial [Haematococcus lacustris]
CSTSEASYDVGTGLPAPGHTSSANRSDAGRQVLQATLPPTPPPSSGPEAPLGSCSNPVLLTDLPPTGQVTLMPGEANCTLMQRSWNMFWGLPWDAGYLLPANSSAYRLLTIDTCLPGVAGSVGGALGFVNETFTQTGCGGSLSFTAEVGQAYLIVVSGTTSGYVMLGRCNNPIVLANLPSNGAVVINTPGGRASGVVLQPSPSTCGQRSSWYQWPSSDFTYLLLGDAAAPRRLTLETCVPGTAAWDTVLVVTWSMTDDDSSPRGRGCSQLTFTAAVDQDYFIIVEGYKPTECGSPAISISISTPSATTNSTGRRLMALGSCGNPYRIVRLFA